MLSIKLTAVEIRPPVALRRANRLPPMRALGGWDEL